MKLKLDKDKRIMLHLTDGIAPAASSDAFWLFTKVMRVISHELSLT